jgi:integrase
VPILKTDKKKNGLQGYRVIVNYMDESGRYKKIERAAYGKAEAQATEQLLMAQVAEAPAGQTSLRDLFDEYITDKSTAVRTTTCDKVRRVLENSVMPFFEKSKIDDLTPKKLQAWKNDLSSQDKKISTKQKIFQEFSTMLKFAVRRGYIKNNPLDQIGNFKDVYFERPQDVLRYYTAAEYRLYSKAARELAESRDTAIEWGCYVFFCVAFYTGARKGEINALRWSDIDGNIMHIRRSISQKVKGDDLETPPKNKSSYRDLQIPRPLLDILAEHKQRQGSDPRFSEEWRVCGGSDTLRDTTIEKKNTAYAEAAGLPHIRVHDFRHTHATVLVNEGINIQEIARRLGHAKVEQTWNTYAHLYPREEERAVSILDKITI